MRLLGVQSYTLHRYDGAPTVDADGYPVRPTATVSTIQATICDAPIASQQYIPEGVRGRRLIEIVSYSEVRAVRNGEYADHILFDGGAYEVQVSARLPAFSTEAPHWEALATEVRDQRRER